MCDKCDEIDKKVEHFRTMASRVTDQPLLAGINGLIQQTQDQKLELHPKEE